MGDAFEHLVSGCLRVAVRDGGLGDGVQGLGLGGWGARFGVEDIGFRVKGLRFRV